MKNAIILVCLLFSAFAGYSQVGIGTKNPDSTSVLDLSSTTKGLLIPRMTTSQRDRIETPAVGLQVYNLDDHCLDMYDGKSWLKHCGSESGINSRSVDDLIWALEGDDIYTVPMENVGIGTSDPDESALLDLTSYSKGFLMPRMSTMYRDAIASPAQGLQILNTDDYCIDIYNGANWVKHCGMKENGQILTQAYWQQRADFMSVRRQAVGFSIGSKGYIGTGTLFFSDDVTKDFWEYDPALDTWTQKADCGTLNRGGATGFSIGNFGYIGTGYDDDGGKLKDFWQYNPNNNTWTKKLDFPGEGRSNSVGFSIEGKGYIGTGKTDGSTGEKDFYRYNPDNNSWAPVADLPGSKRYGAVAFTIFYYGYAYVGGGASSNGAPHDFWKYNPFNDSWLPIDNLPDPYGTSFSVGLDLYYRGGVVTGNGIGNQFFIYDPSTEEWSTGIPFPGYPRNEATGFSINGIGYVGTGSEVNNTTWPAMYVDFWRISAGNFVNSYESTLTDPYYNSISVSDGLWTQELSGGYLDVPGNLGIGITSPQNKIDINSGSSRTGHHPLNRPLYVTGDILANSSGVEFRDVNGTQGIGFGYNTIYATGSNTDQNLGLKARGSGILNFITDDAERMRITGGGNVGIGLTTPKTKLHILGGSSASLGETTGYAVFGPTTGANLVLDENEILARNNGAVANLILQEEGGNVGIGTSGPEELLEVGGSGRAFFGDGGEGNNRTGLLIDGNESGDFTRLESYDYQTQTGMNLIINSTGHGNVGIGTPSAHAPLQFRNSYANRKIVLYENANNDHQVYGLGVNDNVMRYQVPDTFSSHILYAGTSATTSAELMRIQGNGKVGIGISNAKNKLDINANNRSVDGHPTGRPLYVTGSIGESSNGIEFRHDNGSQGIGFGFNTIYATGSNADQDLGLKARGAFGNLKFTTNNIERMRILGNGNVGIGNPTPNAPLQFANSALNRKVVLYEDFNNDHQFFGLGIGGAILRYQVGGSGASHVFYAGTSTTTSAELMRITGTGNVGIGNPTPHAPLHFANVTASRKIVLFETTNDNNQFIGFGVDPATLRYNVSGTALNHVFYAGTSPSSSVELMRIQGNGKVGIGVTTAPSFTLEVNGTAGKPGGGFWSGFSDSRLKKDVQPYTDGLDKICKIRPVKYHYNEKSSFDNSVEYVGVIAQELQEVAPYMVSVTANSPEKYLEVDNSSMIYMLINAVKEQQVLIDSLQQENAALQNKYDTSISDLQLKLMQMEAMINKLAAERKP